MEPLPVRPLPPVRVRGGAQETSAQNYGRAGRSCRGCLSDPALPPETSVQRCCGQPAGLVAVFTTTRSLLKKMSVSFFVIVPEIVNFGELSLYVCIAVLEKHVRKLMDEQVGLPAAVFNIMHLCLRLLGVSFFLYHHAV